VRRERTREKRTCAIHRAVARERTNFARPCHVRSPESSGINDDACVAKWQRARPASPDDYDRLLSSILHILTRFRTLRDSFDLPPRPPISKRTTAGRIVDMSPLIEEENSSGINRGYKSLGTNTEWRRSRVIGMMLLLARGRRTRRILCSVIGRTMCRVTRLPRERMPKSSVLFLKRILKNSVYFIHRDLGNWETSYHIFYIIIIYM